jgi:hypothetical protein
VPDVLALQYDSEFTTAEPVPLLTIDDVMSTAAPALLGEQSEVVKL